MERLDRDAEAMIERRQNLALGASSAQDENPVPDAPENSSNSHSLDEPHPATTDPPRNALPAATDTAPTVNTDELPPPITDAGEPVQLDLEGVLGYAMRSAPDYRRQKEELFLSTLALIVERHLWGPRFFSGVRAQLDGTPESGDYDTANSLIADLGVTQRLPYGGTISASALAEYVSFLRQASTSTADEESQTFGINVALELPLLRGAGRVAREDLVQAERNLVYAVRGFERFRREFLVDLSATYFDLVFAQQEIRNQELQLSNLAFVATQFRSLADAGKIRGFQAEQIEQDVLSARNRLLNLRERYANTLDRFKIDLGMDTATPLVIEPVDVSVPPPLLDIASSVATAWALRLDLQTDSDVVQDAVRAVRNARNGLAPDLDLEADLNLRTDDGKRIAGFDVDAGASDYRVALDFELPLDRRVEWSNLRSAQVREQRRVREHRVFRDEIALEVRRAIRQIEQARFHARAAEAQRHAQRTPGLGSLDPSAITRPARCDRGAGRPRRRPQQPRPRRRPTFAPPCCNTCSPPGRCASGLLVTGSPPPSSRPCPPIPPTPPPKKTPACPTSRRSSCHPAAAPVIDASE